jgi:hypothetical protein
MSQAVRTTVTILVLCAVIMVAAVWAWGAATEPLPAKVDLPICVDTAVVAGESVYPAQVTVSVYNASDRDGLAGRTMQSLRDAGFAEGQSGNAKGAKVPDAAIWTDNPNSPAVQLVASHLGPGVEVEVRQGLGAGVTVVVGNRFETVVKGHSSVTSEEDTEICTPPAT